MTDVRITVDGRDDDQESLWDWLRHEPDFRGHLRQAETPGPPGTMGASTELIVGVVSSGAATALVTSLQVWLTQRRADVKVSVTGPQGRTVVLDAKRIADAGGLLDTALGWAAGPPVPPAAG